MKMSYKTNI